MDTEHVDITIRMNASGKPMLDRVETPAGVLKAGETLNVPVAFFTILQKQGCPVEEVVKPAAAKKKKAGSRKPTHVPVSAPEFLQ